MAQILMNITADELPLLPLCHWCGQPVLPEQCIILKTDDGPRFYVHWECIAEAKRTNVGLN